MSLILSDTLYKEVSIEISKYQRKQQSQAIYLTELSKKYHISYQTLTSIASHLYLLHTKNKIRQYHHDSKKLLKLYQQHITIYKLSQAIDLSPYLTARLVLQLLYPLWNKKKITQYMRQLTIIGVTTVDKTQFDDDDDEKVSIELQNDLDGEDGVL